MIDPEDIFKFENPTKLSEESAHVLTWVVPLNLPYFDGHFPENPILPAVAILDGTLEILKRICQNRNLTFKKIRSGKFLNIITPGTALQIRLIKIQENEWEAEWKSSGGEKSYAYLKIGLRSAGAA